MFYDHRYFSQNLMTLNVLLLYKFGNNGYLRSDKEEFMSVIGSLFSFYCISIPTFNNTIYLWVELLLFKSIISNVRFCEKTSYLHNISYDWNIFKGIFTVIIYDAHKEALDFSIAIIEKGIWCDFWSMITSFIPYCFHLFICQRYSINVTIFIDKPYPRRFYPFMT